MRNFGFYQRASRVFNDHPTLSKMLVVVTVSGENDSECYKIDAKNKKVYCRSTGDVDLNGNAEFVVDYDYLVVAMGARANTFNTPGVEENCHFLKELEDAQRIRRTVIDCFEKASQPNLTDEVLIMRKGK